MASTANVVLMRYSELEQGIEVFDAEDRQIGTSKAAAKKVILINFVAKKNEKICQIFRL